MSDEPTCWIVFPVYKTPAAALKRMEASDLAGRFIDTVCDVFQYAEHGFAKVVEFNPLTDNE